MTMSWIWTGMLMLSFLYAIISGNGATLSAAVQKGAQSGLNLAISIGGSICLWTGVGKLMERSGITGVLTKLLSPVLGRIFPSTRKDKLASDYLSANVCANLLGLGNAATPMGIQAAKRLVNPRQPTIATDELCRLIVLNTASIQLIPANVAAVRAGLGAASPFDILPAVWVTSLCSAGIGLVVAWGFGKVWRHD